MRQSTILAYGYLHTIWHSPVCVHGSHPSITPRQYFVNTTRVFYLLQKSVLFITNVVSDEIDIEHLICLVEEKPVIGDKSLDEYKSERERWRDFRRYLRSISNRLRRQTGEFHVSGHGPALEL